MVGEPNLPDWTEVEGSPFTWNSVTSATLNLPTTYDEWYCIITITDESSSSSDMRIEEINGALPNYNYITYNGSGTSGASFLPFTNLNFDQTAAGAIKFAGRWTGDFGTFENEKNGTAASSTTSIGGVAAAATHDSTSPMSSIEFERAGDETFSMTLEVYGRDIA